MTSLRERLEAKERRRLVQPIQVSDSSEDQQSWLGVTAALQVAQQKHDDERDDAAIKNLQAQLDAAWERVRSHYVDVVLQSMPRADWNAAMHEWQGDDTIDWAEALAPLLAASCVDEELRDEQWWKEQLARDSWAEGDTDSLKAALLHLNTDALDARYPKD